MVEDSKTFASLVKRKIKSELGFEVTWVQSFGEAKNAIEARAEPFFIALVELILPDAPNGEIVDYVVSQKIPTIVFTGDINDDLRDTILSKHVIDYVLKESALNIDYLIGQIRRIHSNQAFKILVVDDSRTARNLIRSLLQIHLFQVVEASNGIEAINVLNATPDIKLVITDFNMPHMDGFELIKTIRRKYRKDEVAIIGVSAIGNNIMAARFIKNGANDFLNKPFFNEEFYCRVTHNVEMIEQISLVKESSSRDYLTGLHNRRYFFETGRKIHAGALRSTRGLAVAIIDIDNFKAINDTYGHDAGDDVLKFISGRIGKRFRESDVAVRFGGEEFCILLTDIDAARAYAAIETLRQDIEAAAIDTQGNTLHVTFSAGVCAQVLDSLERMISSADAQLYEAKRSGKNKVLLAPAPA